MCRLLHIAIIGSVLAASGMASADSVTVFLNAPHQGEGDKGAEFRPVDEHGGLSSIVLSALSSIDGSNPFDPAAASLDASVYVDKYGTGVMVGDEWDFMGISGRGADGDQQLNIAFDDPTLASSIDIGLMKFNSGGSLGQNDDAILFIHLADDDDVLVLDETEYMSAFVSTGRNRGYIDFETLGLGDALVDWIGVRETRNHIEVNSVTFASVPLPAPLLLGLAGLIGVASARLRRRGAAS